MNNEIVATVLWRRTDTPGHDACVLARGPDGWRLGGCAVFEHEGQPCALSYSVECDRDWRTLSATVRGNVGLARLMLDIARTPSGGWLLNGVEQPDALRCVDIDLGFTPATNLIAIRRLKPREDVETAAPAAYYLEFTHNLGIVEQTYRRLDDATLAYASPAYDYAAELKVAPSGFVLDYPGLWAAVSWEQTERVHETA